MAYAWDNNYYAQGSMHVAIEYGVVNPLISPPESGGSGSLSPYNSTFNTYTWSGDQNGNPGYLSSLNDAYILRRPIIIANLDYLLSQTNAPPGTNAPAKL